MAGILSRRSQLTIQHATKKAFILTAVDYFGCWLHGNEVHVV
jgi:hypothetical protein